MKIEHVAIWVNDLESMRSFYQTYFNMQCSKKYQNSDKGFSSYFLSFDSGARLEIMKKEDIINETKNKGITNGLTHLAISVGSKEAVDACTDCLRRDAFTIYGEPRTTGDGYYESVILDPEGNHIEITE